MERGARLRHARSTQWVQKYEGKNIVRGYGRWFGVDRLCAIIELRALGVQVDQEYERQVRNTIETAAAARKGRKLLLNKRKIEDSAWPDSDDTFAYIAGRTAGGAAYGVTWDELGEQPLEWGNDSRMDA